MRRVAVCLVLLGACGGDGVANDSAPVVATAIAVAAPGATGVSYPLPARLPPKGGREAPDPLDDDGPAVPDPFAPPGGFDGGLAVPKPPQLPLPPKPPTPPTKQKGTEL